MLQILPIVLISVLLLLATTYLIYSRYSKKNHLSRYWNYQKIKPEKFNTIRGEFQNQDQLIIIYKEAIQKTIRLRNLLQQTRSELNISLKDIENYKNSPNTHDNSILVELHDNFIQLNSEFKSTLEQITKIPLKGPDDLLNKIYLQNVNILISLDKLLTPTSEDRDHAGMLLNATNEITDNHERVIVIHKELISLYQDTITKI